ncbi:glycosyltransferase [Streptomyces sp. HB132]|uniref:glycosyltransferase n=1 Tax=Streptomyces sp. HB132 TaxID=767388 RepID=UPI001961FDCC|nr:glycosyltransferase [Streptomyces sp. HB132]MBM7442937.1 O-mycaminosyltylonolide 6-deoxyallosyltransferase [Streptomyces sp. HB132]
MRASLVVLGSRGDVQPFIALGTTLKARGHAVTLATHGDFETLVREAGLDFIELPGSPRDFLAHPALAEALQQGASLFRAARKVPRPTAEHIRELAAKVAKASAGADLVVNSILSRISFESDDSAPWGSVTWWPLNPTAQWPAMILPQYRLGRPYNRLTHRLAGLLDWITIRGLRKDASLPPLPFGAPYGNLGKDVPLLCPVTRALFTEPSDWPERSHITGYWFWDRKWTPPQELVDFMDSGTPPVTLSFGSIWPVHPPAETLEKVLAVVRSHGRRLVLVGGGPTTVPEDVFRIDDVHYPWLLPRSAAFIHHGGCNTTGEALRSGRPQVVVPTFADSPFWAANVHALGVAAKPIPFRQFTAERLDEALGAALSDDDMRRKAHDVGETVRAEHGTEKASEILEEWVRHWRTQKSIVASA